MYRLPRQSQDLVSLDTSPVKEQLEERCVHPLDEAMLGCDVDGEVQGTGLMGRRVTSASHQGQGGQVMSVSCSSSRFVCGVPVVSVSGSLDAVGAL